MSFAVIEKWLIIGTFRRADAGSDGKGILMMPQFPLFRSRQISPCFSRFPGPRRGPVWGGDVTALSCSHIDQRKLPQTGCKFPDAQRPAQTGQRAAASLGRVFPQPEVQSGHTGLHSGVGCAGDRCDGCDSKSDTGSVPFFPSLPSLLSQRRCRERLSRVRLVVMCTPNLSSSPAYRASFLERTLGCTGSPA